MTLTPFRGRCPTCGHDHDVEGQTLHDILATIDPRSRIEADRAAMQQALEALAADDSKLWPSEKRTAALAALRERLK